MTKQVDILSTNEAKTTATSSVVENKTAKESPSLFDALMAKAKSKVENKDITAEKSNSKIDNKSSEKNVVNTDSTKESKSSEISKKDTSSVNKTDTSIITKESKTDKTNDSKNVKVSDSKVDSKNEKASSSEVEESKKDVPSKVSKQSSGSLLDRLVLEAKNTIKTTSQEEFELKLDSKNKENKESIDSKKESLLNPNTKEITKENKVDNTALDNKKTEKKSEELKNQEAKDLNKTKVEKDTFIDGTKVEDKSEEKSEKTTDIKKVKKDQNLNVKVENTNTSGQNVEVDSELSLAQSKANNTFASSNGKKEDISTKSSNISSDKTNTKVSDIASSKSNENTKKTDIDTNIKEEILESKKDTKKSNTLENTSDSKNINTDETKVVKTQGKESSLITSNVTSKDKNEVISQKLDKTSESIIPSKEEKNENRNLINNNKVDDKTNDKKIQNNKVEQTSVENTSSKSVLKNEKVANELASISKDNKTQTANISKEELSSSQPSVKKEENKSLMDKLIEKNQNEIKNQALNSDKKINETKAADSILPESKKEKTNNSSDFISNMYLSSQKNSITKQSLANKKEAQETIVKGKSTGSVDKSAKILDLGLEKLEVEVKASEVKKDEINHLDKKSSLDRLAFNKNIRSDENNSLITKSVEASKAVLDESTSKTTSDVTINVNPSLALSIQNKIIGAKQSMSTMMSDVAKKMYENYKPPVTAFKINLNPGTLGGIAIVLKSDKDNAISISMNISNSATLDTFVENQNSLKSALNKTFDEDTQFNLDFSSNDGQNQSSNNNNDENKDNFFGQNSGNTQAILNARENNQEVEDKNLDYM